MAERPQTTLPFLAYLERLTTSMVKPNSVKEQPHA
jgi:hypothetical protein